MTKFKSATIPENLDTEIGTSVVRLAEAEYGSLDTEKLANVGGLLSAHAERAGLQYLLVDLSAVDFFGAALVGLLVSTWDRLRKRDRKLVLCGLTPYCSKLIRTLHLDELFDIYATQLIALDKIARRAGDADDAAGSRGIRVRKSDVAWDPNMVRLEYVGEDNVPFRTIIVPRTEESSQACEWQGS
jgi:anti-anti-sigma factor